MALGVMNKVRAWIEKRGFCVAPGAFHAVDVESHTVFLKEEASRGAALTLALHECGHMSIYSERARFPKRSVAGASLRQFLASQRKTAAERLAIVEEEFEAWRRGEEIGKSLGIRLPPAKLRRRVKASCLRSHVAWCTRTRLQPRKRHGSVGRR